MDDRDRYGRSEESWDELEAVGLDFLRDRAKLGRTTSYTEMNAALSRKTDQRPFDFSRDSDRAAMGYLLGRIVEADRPESGMMISALVVYLDANDAGSGFYRLAEQIGLLAPRASAADRERFWIEQVAAAHQAWRPARRSPRT